MKRRSPDITFRNRVHLVQGGKPYFDCLIGMIESARETIHLQTYIFDDDETGRLVGDALKSAAKKNVEVFVMVDGYASQVISKAFVNELRAAGVHFRFFSPILKSPHFYIGRRLHHKVAVVDSQFALLGGLNIANRYNDMPGKQAWLDFALYIEGEAAKETCTLCEKTWNNFTMVHSIPCKQKVINQNFLPGEYCEVSLSRNDWVRRKTQISTTYVNMFRNAESHIIILCSYFLPGRVIRRQLNYAAQRGIRIKVITAGISDILLAKSAERYMYGWLLNNNIELYEYQPRILHGKVAVCDSEWMTLGSYNINDVSTYASIELNATVRNADLAIQTEQVLLEIIEKDCVSITKAYYFQTKNPLKQFVRWFSYQFIRCMIYFFTFYFKHQP